MNATDPKPTKHEALKTKLADAFRASGHVAAHVAEQLAETAAGIALAGKFGE
jgi:hypothetical protein